MGTSPVPSAAWMRARSALRIRARPWLGLAVLLGVAGGFVASAAAGARRTATVYERLLAESDAFDLAVEATCRDGSEDTECAERLSATVDGLPSVEESARVSTFLIPVTTAAGRSLQPGGDTCYTGSGEVDVVGSADDRFGTTLNRRVFVDGGAATNAGEVVLSEATARRVGIDVGDRLRIFPISACDGAPRNTWPAPITVRVAGIHRSAGEIPPEAGFYLQSVGVTPALRERLLDTLGADDPFTLIRLRDGATRADFTSDAKRAGVKANVGIDQSELANQIERGLGTDVTTMWLLAALGGVVAAVVLGQAITRQVWLGSGDLAALRAIGYTRRDVATAGAFEGAVVGVVAALFATVLALAVSTAWPIGKARRIEPDPGLAFDPIVVAGAVVVVVFTTLVAALATRRAATTRAESSLPRRASRVDAWMQAAHAPPTATCGARMLRRAGGAVVVPLRSSLAGITVGVIALVGAITFAAGLDHLVETPRVVGWNWDLAAFGDFGSDDAEGDPRERYEAALEELATSPDVERVGYGTFFPSADVSGIRGGPGDTYLVSFSGDPGAIGPTVISGRAPAAPDEILLAPGLLDNVGRDVGDTLMVDGLTAVGGGEPRPTSANVEIVGTGVLPVGDGRLDTAAAMTFEGLQRLSPDATPQVAFVDVVAGGDAGRVRRELADLGFEDPIASDIINGEQLVNLDVRQANAVPRVLAVLMALLAAGVLVHLLATNVRARRAEFATLRAMGFTKRQRRATVVWLGGLAAALSLVVAVPVGVVVGRLAWRIYAANLGVLPEPMTPWIGLALVVAATLLLTVVVAAVVARGVTGAITMERVRDE